MNRVYMVPNAATWGDGESGIKRVAEAYTRHLPKFGWEVVTSHDAVLDIVAVHAGIMAPVCHVAHCHGLYWTSDYHAAAWEWASNRRVTEMCRVARRITVPSEWVAESFRRDMRVNPIVLGHGLDLAEWGDPSAEREGYILWNKNRTGDVCDPKPVGVLARAFPQHRFLTTFAPHGDYHNLKVTGLLPHDEMKRVLRHASVYLATTKETFGIGILEAMACGVPVLGYDHGGIKDLVVHGTNGYLAKVGDELDLQAGLAYCMEHRKVLGDNGREMVKAHDWERQVEKLARIYDDAALVPLPKTAIVIPSYNYAGKVHQAIKSALAQDYPLLSLVVVVDDGSPDDGATEKVVKQYMDDNRLRYVRQDNQGVAIARNAGIEVAWQSGCKYVACLDADDWLDPAFLSTCIRGLEADPSLGIAYTGLYYHKPDGTHGLSTWPGEWDFDAQLMRRNQIPTACVFRTDMWRRLGGYKQRYAPLGAGAEDAEFWLRSGAYGFGAKKVSPKGLFHYAWQSGGVSGNPDYREVEWTAWHPWAGKNSDHKHPFASYAKPQTTWHPVRQYDEPTVSVIIPVGPSHQQYLPDALDSLEAQTFRNWEAVVVVDSKEAIPPAIIDAYPYVRWGRTDGLGAGAARNEGVRLARGAFIVFLDADDYLTPTCIEVFLEAWRLDGAIPYSDYLGKAHVDDVSKLAPDLQKRVYFHNPKTHEALIGYQSADYDCELALRQPEIPYPFIWCNVTCLVPKAWHNEIGGFDESMKSWEDVEYNWRMARAGHCFIRVAMELMVYRFSTGTRRQDGLQHHQSIVEYIRKKWGKDEPVGCGCNKGQSSVLQAQQRRDIPLAVMIPKGPTGSPPMDDSQYILAKYTHPNVGQHVVIGAATQTKYGYRGGGEIFLVNRQDVAAQPHLFSVIPNEPLPIPLPAAIAPPPPLKVVETTAEVAKPVVKAKRKARAAA
jgi:glycosyltransferase involved in cell wall biosynthesis